MTNQKVWQSLLHTTSADYEPYILQTDAPALAEAFSLSTIEIYNSINIQHVKHCFVFLTFHEFLRGSIDHDVVFMTSTGIVIQSIKKSHLTGNLMKEPALFTPLRKSPSSPDMNRGPGIASFRTTNPCTVRLLLFNLLYCTGLDDLLVCRCTVL